ncbi:MAG: SusC/RagA family TonB-linked outer membrane protein [Bacteroidales bacterium]|nr:SusC/RagA family TonB-linked outer membrane protein [Bacteroidales bacterium]
MRTLQKLFFATAALLLAGLTAFAQNKTVTGTVLDERGDVLPGATVVVDGNKAYAITDLDGKFNLQTKQGAQITVSYLGYDDYVFTVGSASNYKVNMVPSEATLLKESVAIGYGTTTKKEVTGSVVSLKSDDFDKGSFTSAAGMLQGKVAGLSVTNPNGADPNASYEILLRGTNTLSAGQGPLIIIDGVVGADIRTINFQEVESIDVLKDGSAAAIYGTRGTNGVLIITTKRAKAGQTSVSYDGQVSVQTVRSRAIPMTSEQFASTIHQFKPESENVIYGADTDWFKEVTRTPISHKHNLAIAGGSEKFSHRTVINVEQNQGLLKNNDANKYLFKTNLRQEALEGWLNFDVNLSYVKRKYNGARTGIFRQAFLHNPTEPIYDETNTEKGGYFTKTQSMDYYNPVAMLNERSSQTEVDDVGVNGRITLNILPVKGLKWDNFVSYGIERYENRDYRTRYYPGEYGLNGTAEISNSKDTDIQYESTLQYNNHFGKHHIQAVAGYAFQECNSSESYMSNYGFDLDYFQTNNMAAGSALKDGKASMSSSRESSRYVAFFGRAMYNYQEKYMASVSLRYDGSSRFGVNNKWALFPAVSVGWRISQEPFMKNVSWVEELKLRAGFGMTGNQDFSNYKSILRVEPNGHFYYDGKWSNSYAPSSNANPDLQWEKKSEWNVGLDFSLLKGRLGGTIDYYYRLTTNLLYDYKVPVPPYDYEKFFTNVGSISNSGIEITIYGEPVKTKNFSWNSSLVFAMNQNKLISFTNEEFQGQEYRIAWLSTPLGVNCQRLIEGQSIGTFYGPIFTKFGSDGNQKLKNVDQNEWVNLGSAYPLFTVGWSNTLNYGPFSLSATFRASIGGVAYNQMRALYENINEFGKTNALASWLNYTEYTGKVVYSDRCLEDASYLKLDNVTFSYDIPWKNKFIKGARVYLTGQNLLCITGYTGVDPEVRLSGLTPGIEGTSYYPRTRMFTLGATIKF